MINNTFIKKIGIYFIGSFSSKIFSALLIPIYAFYVTTSDLGKFDFYQTIMSMVAPIVVLAIWESILKFSLSAVDDEMREITVALGSFFSIIMLILCCIIFGMTVILNNNLKTFMTLVILIVSYVLAQVWQYCARGLKLSKVFALSGVYSTIVNFVLIILLVVINKFGFIGLIISFVAGQITVCIYIEKKAQIIRLIFKKIKLFNLELLIEMLQYSTPLVFNLMSIWAINSFGRFLIIHYLGTESNGIFSFANKFSLIVNMVGIIINMAFIEETLETSNRNDFIVRFENQIKNVIDFFVSAVTIFIPIISLFYVFIGDTPYKTSLSMVFPLIFYASLNIISTNQATIFQAKERTNILFVTTVSGAIINIVFAWLFIHLLGLWSIVYGQVLGSITMLLFRIVLAKKMFKASFAWGNFLKVSIIFSVVCVISYHFSTTGNILLLIGILFMFYFKYKNKIIGLLEKK